MTEYEKLVRLVNEYRNDVLKLRARIDGQEKTIRDMASKNMELQGKVATLAGRIRGGER
jgi:peptidoglycan hydrolase CwlO-like protein